MHARAARSVLLRSPSPWRAEARATLALAVPLALSQLAQVAIQTTDVVMMGWLGPASLAAGALGANVFLIQLIFGMGVVTAVSPLVAHIVGGSRRRGNVREVRRAVRQGVWMATIIAVPAMIACWQVRPILIALGQDAHLAALAEDYVHGLLWAMPFALWFVVLRCFVSALSRTRVVFAITLWGVLCNALAVYTLMFGKFGVPALGLFGAGLASTGVHASMAALLLIHVLTDRRFRRYALLGRLWRPDGAKFREILRIGAPIGAMWVLEMGVFTAALLLMGLIGTTAIAAHQIALQCAAFTFMVPLGVSQAATVRVGLAAGAGDADGVRRAGWTGIALGSGFMVLTCVLFLLAGRTIAALFLDGGDPAAQPVTALAAQLLIVAGVFQVFDGAQTTAAGALRGLKDTRVPLAIAALGYWAVAFPLGAALAFVWDGGAIGIWVGLAAGIAVVALLLNDRFRRMSRASESAA